MGSTKNSTETSSSDPPVPFNPLVAEVNEFYWDKFLNDFTLAEHDFSKFPLMSKFKEIKSVMERKNRKNVCLKLAHDSSELLYNLTDKFSVFQVLASQKKEQKRKLFRFKSFMDYTTSQNMKNELDEIRKELEDIEDKEVVAASVDSPHEKSKQTYGLTYGDPGNTSQIIGLDEHVKKITERLMVHDSTDTSFKVTGIYGMCGTGKTALAQKVFNDPKVCETFSPRIWICCSHTVVDQVDRIKVMKMVFEELGYDCDELNGLGITELLAAMKLLLNGKRYLFVVDDVWGTDEWFENLGDNPKEDVDMKRFSDGFPRDSGGAVLLTCRNPETAMKMVGEENLYNLEPLDEESCEKIFHKYMGTDKTQLDEKGVSEAIFHFHGLPLAAKELAKTKSIPKS